MTPAQRYDVTVPTGARWSAEYVRYAPGPAVPAGTIVAGQRVYVDGLPRLVATVVPEGLRVILTFGRGLYDDARLALHVDSLVAPAEAVPITEAVAAFTLTDVDVDGLPLLTPVEIPTVVEVDGTTVTLGLTADETVDLFDWPGAHSWDLYVRTADEDWQRALEGTFTVVRGDAR